MSLERRSIYARRLGAAGPEFESRLRHVFFFILIFLFLFFLSHLFIPLFIFIHSQFVGSLTHNFSIYSSPTGTVSSGIRRVDLSIKIGWLKCAG